MLNYKISVNKNSYKKAYKLSVLLVATLGLQACSWFSANDGREEIDNRYMASKQTQELQIPAEVSELKVEDQFSVPQGLILTERDPKGQMLSLEPPQLLLIGGDGIREDKEAQNPTIWLRATPQDLMASIQLFANEQQINLLDVTQESVQTDWIDDDSDTPIAQRIGVFNIDGQRHKFSLKVLPQNNNEIGLQSLHSAAQYEQDGGWADSVTTNGAAKQFLNNFISFYGIQQARIARAKILEEGTIKTKLGTDKLGNMAIVTERDFQAVWQQLAKVLPQMGLEIIDRDQSKGTYYYLVKEEPGFWSSMFGDELQSKIDLAPGEYQILVETLANNGTSMTLKNAAGELLSSSKVSEVYPEFSSAFRSRVKEK